MNKDIIEQENIDQKNEDLKKSLEESEKYWSKTVSDLASKLTCTANEVIQLQAEVISLRQVLVEEIKNVSYQIFKFLPKIKIFKKERFEYYSLDYKLKTTGSEKIRLIEADLSVYEYRVNILDNHIEFLRETLKNMDNINFAIKNKITLYQLTDLE